MKQKSRWYPVLSSPQYPEELFQLLRLMQLSSNPDRTFMMTISCAPLCCLLPMSVSLPSTPDFVHRRSLKHMRP